MHPCQTELINTDLSGGGNAFVHSCIGCSPANAFFYMQDMYRLCTQFPIGQSQGVIMMNAQASFQENQFKIEICEVNPLQPTQCISATSSTGWLNGQADIIDLYSLFTFQGNKVTLRPTPSIFRSSCLGYLPSKQRYGKKIFCFRKGGFVNSICFERPEHGGVFAVMRGFRNHLALVATD